MAGSRYILRDLREATRTAPLRGPQHGFTGPMYDDGASSGLPKILPASRKRSRVVVLDEPKVYEAAKKVRETFYGKDVKKAVELPFSWPDTLVYMGRAVSELYFSDKMLNGGKWEIYKHVAEAGQDLYVNPAITNLVRDDGQLWRYRRSDRWQLKGAMPKTVAVLAENRCLQVVTTSGEYYEIRLMHSTLAAAKHPETDETFLLVYSKEGVHFIVTGDKLSIGEGGIEW